MRRLTNNPSSSEHLSLVSFIVFLYSPVLGLCVSVQSVFQVTDPDTPVHIFQFTSQSHTPVTHPSLPAQFIYPGFPQFLQLNVSTLTVVGHFVALRFPGLTKVRSGLFIHLCPCVPQTGLDRLLFKCNPLQLLVTNPQLQSVK